MRNDGSTNATPIHVAPTTPPRTQDGELRRERPRSKLGERQALDVVVLRDPTALLDFSRNANGNRDRTVGAAGFSTNDRNIERPRRLAQTAVEFARPSAGCGRRREQGHERKLGDARHGSKITQRSRHCFPTHRFWLRIFLEVNPFHHAISLEEEKLLCGAEPDDCAVIARSRLDLRVQWKVG